MEDKQRTHERKSDARMTEESHESSQYKDNGEEARALAKIEFYKGVQVLRREKKILLK